MYFGEKQILKKIVIGCETAEVDEKVLNIAYGVDENFLFGAAVSMQSIAMNNTDIALRFHLFTDSMNDDYIDKLHKFVDASKRVCVTVYVLSDEAKSLFPSYKQWSYAACFRFIAFDCLSTYVERVLYIDADVICKGPLSSLLELDLSNSYAAVVKDKQVMQEKPANRLKIKGLPGNYFNSGVVYANLKKWKESSFTKLAVEMLASDPSREKYRCLDQDILNILLFGQVLFLGNEYNCLYGVDSELENRSDEDYKQSITEDTRLIHYVGITKPWNEWSEYPSSQYFYKAYHLSQWRDNPLEIATTEGHFMRKYQHEWRKKNVMVAAKYSLIYTTIKWKNKILRRWKKISSILG